MFVMFATRLHKSASVQRKDGKYPIVLQITWNRKVRRKRLGIFAHEHQFAVFKDKRRKKEKALLSNMSNVQEFQNHIDDELQRAKDIYEGHFKDGEFNYNRFVELFDRVEEKSELGEMKVAEFCNWVGQEFENNGQANSAHYYRYTGVAVLKVSPKDIPFAEFDEFWLKEFVRKSRERGIKCYNYLVHLRSIFNKAVEEQIVDYAKNPFKNPYTNPRGFDISKYKKSKISKVNGNKIKDLSREQLIELKNVQNLSKSQKKYLAIWWFSFYCFGVNLIDVAKLKYKHIKNGRWYYDRSKTGVGLRTGKPLLQEALDIIQEFGIGGSGDDYVFDILVGYDNSEKDITNRVLR